MDKKTARLNRSKRTRIKLRELGHTRLCVYRTPRHVYAQVISGDGSTVLAAASTVEKDIKAKCTYTGNVESAAIVGKIIANRSKEKGISQVAFDRSGYKYHGRVKALAEAAREHGLQF
ncbi:50S ribosomal protein L18 [Francisella persica ATCC VR-331]|uniref:Large ribosomal subunit protein uL18 n=1 Tax=Francisella persica ATCC VR-331 TaxID=1086726 RepID=A0AAC8ZMU8_9GAMM|nr:50S ribosomal protein L18 [Francisella persica]ALB02026.1 50S ribosomal protein L18 [Francisella persica ATCC VR-331]ANH77281.1 50S ribosomal protein L18 [Francisella persica ATCC VR-331]